MAVSNPPSMSSVIAEFGTAGSPSNLYAYRWGGGIIGGSLPVGDGTVGNPVKLSQFAGLSKGPLDSQSINAGYDNAIGLDFYGYAAPGYGGYGSISPGVSKIYGNAPVSWIYWLSNYSSTELFTVGIQGATNSGWTTLQTPFGDFSRAAASFSSGGWTWNTSFYYAPSMTGTYSFI